MFILCSSFMSSRILDFIHSMAFSRPLDVSITVISKLYRAPLFNLFLSLCKKVSNLEALRICIQIWIYCVAYVQRKFLYENHFDKHQSQTHLLHFFLHVCILNFLHQWLATTQFGTHGIHAHRYYLYPLLLSYNPDTGIKDPHFSL